MRKFNTTDIPMTDRISKLKDALFAKMPEIETDRAVLLTESYMQTENEPIVKRRALAFEHILKNIPITIRDNEKCRTSKDTAIVHFKSLTDNEIEYYVDNYKPFDKAGAYGIQEWIGYMGIDRIDGSYFTIMGLPVHLVYSELQYFLD